MVDMEKPIALSETIMWARSLEWLRVEELSEEVVMKTVPDLAKTEGDQKRLKAAIRSLLVFVRRHRDDLPVVVGRIEAA